MQFTISQKNLQKAMSVIGGCIEKKSNGIASNNVLIESLGENNIRFTAMGQELTVRFDIEAEVKKGGSLCLDGPRLKDIAPVLPDGIVSFEKQKNEWANIEASKSKLKIAGVEPKMFPKVPSGKSTPVSFDGELLKGLIQRVVFIASEEPSIYTMNAIRFLIGDGKVELAGAMQHRIGVAKLDAIGSDVLDISLPKKTALEILKLDAANFRIGDDINHIFIETDGLLLISRKIQGRFPNYPLVMSKLSTNDIAFTFDAAEMIESVKRCGMFAVQGLDSIRLDISKDGAVLSSRSPDAGEISETVDIEYNGEPRFIGVDWRHFLDFLNLAGGGKATFAINQNLAIPSLLTAENLVDYEYMLVLIDLEKQATEREARLAKQKAAEAK